MASDSSDRGFGVAASPLNSVKFELGVVFCVAAVLWLAVDSITANLKGQLLVLALYGLVGMSWIVLRTRRILRRQPLSLDERDGSQ